MINDVSLERHGSMFKTSEEVSLEDFGSIMAERLMEVYASQEKETLYERFRQGASVMGGSMLGICLYEKGTDAKELVCVYGITPFGPAVGGKGFMFDVNLAQGDYILDKIRL